ncbi:MAG: hypothetical protein AAFZ58_02705 [Pseudomonadota bacterium]
MNHYARRCVFLSMDSLEEHSCDDELAIEPLAQLGVAVDTLSWRRDIDWDSYDWVVVRSCWDYQTDVAAFLETLARIDASGARLANPLRTMRANVDKRYLGELEQAGVPIVPTRYGSGLDRNTLDSLLANTDRRKSVIKPVVSAGSHNTFVLSSAMSASERAAVVGAHKASDWMLQPFVDAVVDEGEYSVFLFDGVVSHAILKTPKDNDFRVQEEFGGHIREVTPTPALLDAATHAYRALGERLLYARIDLVEVDGRYCLMEAELIEPSLYLRYSDIAADRFAKACVSWFG